MFVTHVVMKKFLLSSVVLVAAASVSSFAQESAKKEQPKPALSAFDQTQATSQAAIIKKQESIFKANAALKAADDLFIKEQFVPALEKYREVMTMLPTPAPATAKIQNRAYDGAASCLLNMAREDVATGKLDSARSRCDEALSFAPDNDKVKEERARLYAKMGIELDVYGKPRLEENPAVTPSHLKNIVDVRGLLNEGTELMNAGRYDEAEKKFQEVLKTDLDPFNSAARKKMEELILKKRRYADKAREVTREVRMADIDRAWETPIPGVNLRSQPNAQVATISRSNVAQTERKLKTLILPQVSFEQASIEDVVNFLRAKSNELDPQSPINFVINLAGEKGNEISLSMHQVPMIEVIRYATQIANLKYTIQERMVTVVPFTASTENVITKDYIVPPDFFAVSEKTDSGDTSSRGRRSSSSTTRSLTDKVVLERDVDVRQMLIDKGVNFDAKGATVSFNPNNNLMRVSNTPENIELIEALVGPVTATPVQVEIEAKLIELNQTDLDEISTGMNVVKDGNYTQSSGSPLPTPLPNGESYADGMDGFNQMKGLRSNSALQQNRVDGLLARGLQAPSTNNLNFQAKVLNYNLDVLVRALSQKKSIDLLQAPKVRVKTGESAKIEIVRKFQYPESFTAPVLPAAQSGNAPITAPPTVTPTQPSGFKEKDIGVTLTVTPQVSGNMIDMTLTPNVTDFEGFINYGTPVDVNVSGRSMRLTENYANVPVFSTRGVTSNVLVQDGRTVVLGGLLREDIQKIEDKVPLLGDIPVLGRMFRSKVDQSIKKNLMIFVTPRLVKPTGELVNEIEPPVISAKKTASAR